MGTQLEYNGIKLVNVLTRDWLEEDVYDPSGTDLLKKRFLITVEGILHVQADGSDPPAYIGPVVTSESISDLMKRVRRRLQEPRHDLTITVGDRNETEQLLYCAACTSLQNIDRDVDNGPKPQNVKITHLASNKVFRVQFQIACSKVECGSFGSNNFVLNNRWSISESMDENFFTTRRISGTICLSTSQVPAHAFKAMCVPGLEDGFRREMIDFDVGPDGLQATYTVVDRQVKTAAPWPATSISGTHIESTNDGVAFESEMSVRLEGCPNTDPRVLIQRAIQVVDARLNLLSRDNNIDYLIQNAAIIQHFGDVNAVEMRMHITQTGKPGEFLTNLRVDTLGTDLTLPPMAGEPGEEYDSRKNPVPPIYGYDVRGEIRDPAVLFLLSCYLQNPCSGPHHIAQFQTASDGHEESTESRYPKVQGTTRPYPLPSRTEDNYSEGTKKFIYTIARMETRYLIKSMKVQLPIARSSSSSSDEDADTSVVCTLGPKQAKRVIRYEAERVGAPPTMPKPLERYRDGGIVGTLLNHEKTIRCPVLTADGGKRIYYLAALYEYALNRPPKSEEKLRVGALPYDNFTQDDNVFDQEESEDEELGP